MLARLDERLAPARASVDREGSSLRVDADADVRDHVASIVEDLGYVALLRDDEPPVERWFGADDVDELSQEEAAVLAQRWVEEMAAGGIVDEPERLREPLREVLLSMFRDAARTGVLGGAAINQVTLEKAVGERDAAVVRDWLARKLGEIADS